MCDRLDSDIPYVDPIETLFRWNNFIKDYFLETVDKVCRCDNELVVCGDNILVRLTLELQEICTGKFWEQNYKLIITDGDAVIFSLNIYQMFGWNSTDKKFIYNKPKFIFILDHEIIEYELMTVENASDTFSESEMKILQEACFSKAQSSRKIQLKLLKDLIESCIEFLQTRNLQFETQIVNILDIMKNSSRNIKSSRFHK